MKDSSPNSEQRWDALLRAARHDAGPAADLNAVLRVVRAASADERHGWAEEFTLLFGSRRVLPTCVLASLALVGFTSWQAWTLWEALPWVEMVATTMGGVP